MSSTGLSGHLQTVKDRGVTHGDFHTQSNCTENIARCVRNSRNYGDLPTYAKHALEMVSVKLGRILSGDWSYVDHWHDIAGYASLVEQELTKTKGGAH
jgi:hypothetical protein